MHRRIHRLFPLGHALAFVSAFASDPAADDRIRRAEQERLNMVSAVAPAVVSIYDDAERGGGSGVLIDEEGYGLTNFHVIAGMLGKRRGLGGLADGKLYDLEVLGVDPTGDVAMFRLAGLERFPCAPIGDSDEVLLGDTVFAMGNPFILSEDYTPTVTMGIVTGVHRYQWGVGQNLVYSDCIQTDASINPGNSGGPLFNKKGEVIGINGRISVNTRGRFNVGFGYAISSKQIRRFMPALRAGLLAKHGSLQATVEQVAPGDVRFASVRPNFAADKIGIKPNDRLLEIDGSRIETANEFASLMGTYPANWPVRLVTDRQAEPIVVRLDPAEPKLKQSFVPDPEVNRRAVDRAIRRFREGPRFQVDSAPDLGTPNRLVKHSIRNAAGADQRPVRFSNLWSGRTPAEIWEVAPNGEKGDVIRFDEKEVRAHNAKTGDDHTPVLEDALTLAAMYVVQHLLPFDVELAARENVRHVGGDGLFEKTRGDDTVVELVVIPILEGAELELAMDQNGSLRRAVARDMASSMEITLSVTMERIVDGYRRPCMFEVRGPTRSYAEELTPAEVAP